MNVVFLIYRRPDLTARVFAEIRKARPERLFLVADGPKGEVERSQCSATRVIVEQVDWPCEVLKNYSDVNLGCRKRVSSGLDWVFSQVEEAIILEDDCLPCQSFFRFCNELLERYRLDGRIGYISGDNLADTSAGVEGVYHFSVYGGIWGWATWRRSWRLFDAQMCDWPKLRQTTWCRSFAQQTQAQQKIARMFDVGYENKSNAWGYNWFYSMRLNEFLIVVPGKNLVANIGFGGDGTHTTDATHSFGNLPAADIAFPLLHPAGVVWDRSADIAYERTQFCDPEVSELLFWLRRSVFNRFWYGSLIRRLPILGALWAKWRLQCFKQ